MVAIIVVSAWTLQLHVQIVYHIHALLYAVQQRQAFIEPA